MTNEKMVYNYFMASISAERVAYKVIEKASKGEKIKLGEIIASEGYGHTMVKQPTKITRTKSYMAIMQNVVGSMEKQRAKILQEMDKKDLSKEKLATLVSSADILTKNIQLLSGKATENVAMVIEVSEAIAKKNSTHNSEDVKQQGDK